MPVAITDANIFIDLYELNLMEKLFQIGHEIHTTELVLSELSEERAVVEYYRDNNELIVHNLKHDQYNEAINLDVSAGLSGTDRSVVWLSDQWDTCILLTGDNALRKEANKRKTEVHGIFWLFDQWVEAYNLLDQTTAASKLQMLMEINERLPFEECRERIRKWR